MWPNEYANLSSSSCTRTQSTVLSPQLDKAEKTQIVRITAESPRHKCFLSHIWVVQVWLVKPCSPSEPPALPCLTSDEPASQHLCTDSSPPCSSKGCLWNKWKLKLTLEPDEPEEPRSRAQTGNNMSCQIFWIIAKFKCLGYIQAQLQ